MRSVTSAFRYSSAPPAASPISGSSSSTRTEDRWTTLSLERFRHFIDWAGDCDASADGQSDNSQEIPRARVALQLEWEAEWQPHRVRVSEESRLIISRLIQTASIHYNVAGNKSSPWPLLPVLARLLSPLMKSFPSSANYVALEPLLRQKRQSGKVMEIVSSISLDWILSWAISSLLQILI